jgi:hypothetical protein
MLPEASDNDCLNNPEVVPIGEHGLKKATLDDPV